MENKELVINLIRQDLKHNQLLSVLSKIGLEGSDKHSLGILEMLAKLMEVPNQVTNDWNCTYLTCMEEAINYEITNRGECLNPLAEICYMKLKFIIDKGKLF